MLRRQANPTIVQSVVYSTGTVNETVSRGDTSMGIFIFKHLNDDIVGSFFKNQYDRHVFNPFGLRRLIGFEQKMQLLGVVVAW
jgi:hypothetical protein